MALGIRRLLVYAALLAGFIAVAFIASLVWMFAIITNAWGHDSWISRGGLKNAAGEWCCGTGDCFAINPLSIRITSQGYALLSQGNASAFPKIETVPFSEAQPSPDGAFWRCQRPDGSRRCFFAPPPGS